MSPMTRDQALAEAKKLWGDRADSVRLGKSCFLGVQKSKQEWDWRAHGGSWEEAVANARAQEADRKKASADLKEKFSRVPVRIDGDTIEREWRGKTYVVKVLPNGEGFEFAGTKHSSLTAIAKIVTGAASINGRKFFGVDAREAKVKS